MFSLYNYTGIKYDDYTYPLWAEIVGWLITAASILLVPLLILKTVVDICCRGQGGGEIAQVNHENP